MRPELILWDWNGTLLDDVELCVDALNRLLKSMPIRSGTTAISTGQFLVSRLKNITSAPGLISPATALPCWPRNIWTTTSLPARPAHWQRAR